MEELWLIEKLEAIETSDRIALIIVVTICLLLLIVILNAAIRGVPLSEHGAELTSKIILALIAIASFTLGRKS